MEKTNNKNLYALIFRIFGLLTGITAITLQIIVNQLNTDGFMINHVFAYFTVQTNIFSTLVFLALIIKTIIDSTKAKTLVKANINPSLHLACTYYITITMVVYWLILTPMTGFAIRPIVVANTLFLHLFTPLLAIFDSFLFSNHGKVKNIDSIKWLTYPIIYLVSVVIIAQVITEPYYTIKLNGKAIGLMYPYPFLDPQIVTVGGMIGVIILLAIVFVLFGLLYIKIDNLIAKKLSNKNQNI